MNTEVNSTLEELETNRCTTPEREWIVARKELLTKEKELTQLELVKLAQQFDDRSQLFVKQFMLGQ
jgi:predicted dithiol-disulfide oxidoreductase (DUF899 family)